MTPAIVFDDTTIVFDDTTIVFDDTASFSMTPAIVFDDTAIVFDDTAIVFDDTVIVFDGSAIVVDDTTIDFNRRLFLQPAHREVDQFLLPLSAVRGEEHFDGAEGEALVEDAAGVGEGFEAGEAVGFADAAVADAAERQLELVEVDHGVVDRGAAGAGAGDDLARDPAVAAEDVEDERLLPRVDDVERLFERAVGQHRQD